MKLLPIESPATAATLYRRVRQASIRLAGDDPAEETLVAFASFIAARDTFFDAMRLPCTGHNALRLYDAICDSWSLEEFLSDVDHFLPAACLDDEGLFLSTLDTYFSWRDVTDSEGRIYDIEAFLGVTHHVHNHTAIAAWLEGSIGFVQLRAHISNDQTFLSSAVV